MMNLKIVIAGIIACKHSLAYPTDVHSKGIVTPIIACPSGYDQIGKSCVLVKYTDPSKKCNKGKLDGKMCIEEKYIKPDTVCPAGYTLKNKKCESYTTRPAVPYCDKEYQLVNGECIKKIYYEFESKCPEKYHEEDGKCIAKQYTDALYQCPLGFIDDGHKKCISEEILPVEVSCNEGYSLQGDKCILKKYVPKESKCPKGYKTNAGQCVKYKEEKAILICPPGYDQKKKQCLHSTMAPLIPVCPKDTVLHGNVCSKVVEGKLKYICPKGFKDDGRNCIAVEKVEATTRCVVGQDDGKHKCTILKYSDPEIKCLKGEEDLKGSNCYKEKVELAKYQCPKGFKESEEGNHDCVKVTKVKAEFVCVGHEIEGKKCKGEEVIPVSFECKKGYNYVNNRCVKRHDGKGSYFCPKMYKLVDGNMCEKKEHHEPRSVCSGGTKKKDGKCVEHLKPYIECPKKSTMDSLGRCVITENAQMQYKCPKGSLLEGHQCQRTGDLVGSKGKSSTMSEWLGSQFRRLSSK